MKNSKIIQLCKAAKRITVFNDKDRHIQWISDGSALYPLLKLPRFTQENIFAFFDIHEEKQGKIFFEERDELPTSVDISDSTKGDVPVVLEGTQIVYNGRTLVPVKGSTGTLLIDKKYLAPFDEEVTYSERVRENGLPLIVAHEGMFLCGVIIPHTADAKLAEWLINIGETLRLNNSDNFITDVYSDDDEEEEN